MIFQRRRRFIAACAVAAAISLTRAHPAAAQLVFSPGDVVVSVYGDGDGSGTYLDNGASPITLDEYSVNGTSSASLAGTLVLPRTTTTSNGLTNNAISGEYGSSSEGSLALSGNGQYLTIAGYGVNAATFNANAPGFGGGTKSCIGQGTCFPLAQTASIASSGLTVVPRVVALIGANGSVDTSTALTGVFNENNPRSVATVNGTSFYVSGQGSATANQGLFVAQRGASTATQIYGAVDTRTVSIQNNQLFLSSDSTQGSGVTENISTVGNAGALPAGATTPAVLPNLKSQYAVNVSGEGLAQLNFYDQNNLGSNTAFTTASKTIGQRLSEPGELLLRRPGHALCGR